jgi:hypothetical protein
MLNITKKYVCVVFVTMTLLMSSVTMAVYYELGFLGGDAVDPTNWTVGNNWYPYGEIPFEADPNDWQNPHDVDVVWIGNNCVIPSGYVAYVRDFALTANYPGNPELYIPAGPQNQDITMTVKSGALIRSDFNFYVSNFGTGSTSDAKAILNIERGATVWVGWMFYTRTAGIGIVNLNGNVIADGAMGVSLDINARTHIDFDWSGKMVLKGDYRPQFSNASSWVQEGLITDRGVAYGQAGWGTTYGFKTVYDGNYTTITSVAYTPDPNAASNPQPADKSDNVYPDQTLSWTAPVFGPSNMSYKLYFGLNPNLNVTPIALTGSLYTPPSLDKGNTYYWRVDIVNASTGTTVKTGFKWEFTVPFTAKPELISPINDANVLATTVNLQWRADSYAVENKVAVRLVGDPNWSETPVVDTSYHPADLLAGSEYEWKIKSIFSDSSVLESSTWTFNTLNPICNEGQRLPGDENADCKVDLADLVIKTSRWLK